MKKKAATSSAVARELRRRAEEDRATELQKRAERRALEHQAAMDDAKAKHAVEQAKADAAAERRRELEVSRLARKEEDERKAKAARAMEDARWLQVEFPHEVAKKLIEWRRLLPADGEVAFKARVSHLLRFRRCEQTVALPYLWDEDKRCTSALGAVVGIDRLRHSVRCSKTFEWLLFHNSWAHGSPNDATHMLHRLFDRVVPDGRLLFMTRYTSQILLHDSDYVVEKAFLHGVFLLYSWMGAGWMPDGVFQWPPAATASP